MPSEKIIFFDTTLRDGEQTPGVNLNLAEKLKIALRLEKLGVDIIEAGFPATSTGDFEAVQGVSQAVNCGVAALCRCVKSDIDKGAQALKDAKKPRLHLFIATSDIHMEYKLRMSPEKVLANAVEAITYAKTLCDDVEFSCEDASRSRPEFIYTMVEKAIEAGATTINLPDTVGYAIPDEYARFIKGVFENVPNISKAVVSVHCHNDLGLAHANTLAALQSGARQAEVTINGIGERSGNCALEELAMSITTRQNHLNMSHNITTENIYRTSTLVEKVSGVRVSSYKSIVGKNAFAHESGIHQHGMLANPMTYEIMTPESVGKKESTLVLGKHSGRHAFADRLVSMGIILSDEELNDAFARFKDLADRKKEITGDDIEALVTQDMADVPDFFQLKTFQISSGNQSDAMASITLVHEDEAFSEAATGEGPIDAAYNAIRRITKDNARLADYSINAVTSGEDALGEVVVRLEANGKQYTGKGLAPDIIESSIMAYIHAVNRIRAAHPVSTNP